MMLIVFSVRVCRRGSFPMKNEDRSLQLSVTKIKKKKRHTLCINWIFILKVFEKKFSALSEC